MASKKGLASSALFCLAILVFPVEQVAAKQYYKYRDENGKLVIKDHLPPEASQNGYQVLNSMMHVIKTVEPAKTPEQIAEEERQNKEQKKRLARRDAQMEEDARLLRLYPRIDGAVNNRATQLEVVDTDIEATKDFINVLEEQIKTLRRDAAERERQGLSVSPKTQSEIKKAEKDIADGKHALESKYEERELTEKKINGEIHRYLQITANNTISRLKESVKHYDFNYKRSYWQARCGQAMCPELWPTVEQFVKTHQQQFDFTAGQVLFTPMDTKGQWYLDAVVTETYEFDWHVFVSLKCSEPKVDSENEATAESYDDDATLYCDPTKRVELINELHKTFQQAHPQIKT